MRCKAFFATIPNALPIIPLILGKGPAAQRNDGSDKK